MRKIMNAVAVRNAQVELIRSGGRVFLSIPKLYSLDFLVRIASPGPVRMEISEEEAALWELCDGTRTVEEICREVERLGIDAPRVVSFLKALEKEGLLLLEVRDGKGGEKD